MDLDALIARFRGNWADDRAVGAWLRGIARNLHRQGRRRDRGPTSLRRTGTLDDVPPERLSASSSTDEPAGAVAVREAMLRLRQPWRTVLTMRYVEGSGLPEIAAVLGTSVRAVEGRLRRARHELKAMLQQASIATPPEPAKELGR
jgi:RNA polymerase sigma-70 factor (ECF subfamily)